LASVNDVTSVDNRTSVKEISGDEAEGIRAIEMKNLWSGNHADGDIVGALGLTEVRSCGEGYSECDRTTEEEITEARSIIIGSGPREVEMLGRTLENELHVRTEEGKKVLQSVSGAWRR